MTRYTAQGRKGCHTAPGVPLQCRALSWTPSSSSVNKRRRPRLGQPAGGSGKASPPGPEPPCLLLPLLEGFPPSDPGPLLSTGTSPSPLMETPAALELIPSDPLPHGIAMTGTETLVHRGEQTEPASEPRKARSHAHGGPAYPRRCPQVFHQEADVLTRASASLGSPWKRRRGHGPARLGEPTCSEAHPRKQPSGRPPGPPLLPAVVGELTRPRGPSRDASMRAAAA